MTDGAAEVAPPPTLHHGTEPHGKSRRRCTHQAKLPSSQGGFPGGLRCSPRVITADNLWTPSMYLFGIVVVSQLPSGRTRCRAVLSVSIRA
eukprot:7755654-Alexandrium_andersonii.AAC.1